MKCIIPAAVIATGLSITTNQVNCTTNSNMEKDALERLCHPKDGTIVEYDHIKIPKLDSTVIKNLRSKEAVIALRTIK